MVKNKKLVELRKIAEKQKLEFGLIQSFSYGFDSRTKRLVLRYTIPKRVKQGGNHVIKRFHTIKYISQIDENNYKKFFKGSTSIIRDHEKFVEKENKEAMSQFSNSLDEYDFRWWVDKWLDRKVGQTTTIKPLSYHTIKQNRNHIDQYYYWCIENYKDSLDIKNHIDYAPIWFEKYYEEKLTSGIWNGTTCGVSYRNIRGFYNYVADRMNSFPHDILKRLKIPKSENKRDTLNKHEYNKIIQFIIKNRDNEEWKRFILMLRLQLKTGMRVGELVSIENSNIDLKSKCIWVSGKTGRRKLNFNTEDDQLIWNDILKQMNKESSYLFYRTRSQYYTSKKIRKDITMDLELPTTTSFYLGKFREMRDHLKLRGKGIISSHSVRRYFITRFVQESQNRDLTRQIVGHTSTRMTDYYVGNMIDDETKTTISLGL